MNLRILLIPAALIAALAFADTPAAEASPHGISGRTGIAFGPRVVVGGSVGFPVGHRGHGHRVRGHRHARGHYREFVSYVGGYHETRTREVEVPGRQIGYDFKGRPLYAGSRIEIETYRVWIPRRRVVKRVWVPHRHRYVGHRRGGRGYVAVGGRVRLP